MPPEHLQRGRVSQSDGVRLRHLESDRLATNGWQTWNSARDVFDSRNSVALDIIP
jgi:hypothetical protein